jgi:hypothetical protein
LGPRLERGQCRPFKTRKEVRSQAPVSHPTIRRWSSVRHPPLHFVRNKPNGFATRSVG